MINGENTSKETVQSFIDLLNMAKGLMDENQQPSVTQKLGRLLPNTRGGGRRGGSREFLKVAAGESSASATATKNTSFARRSTQSEQLKKYGVQKQHKKITEVYDA